MNPLEIMVPSDRPGFTTDVVDVQHLLERQLTIASSLQDTIIKQGSGLSPKDMKDLSSTASSMIALSHKTEQLLKEISTLRLFTQTVMEFLRQRSDLLGEDLLQELKSVGKTMGAQIPE